MTANSGNRLDDAPLSRFHKKLALYSSGGPFLDGYVLSIIGVAMVQISPQLNLSDSAQGLIGASALIGISLGAFVGGWLTEKFGRQLLYTIDLIAIIVCSVAQFWADDPVWLFILRLLIGMAVGADYPIATSLLAEFTPRRYRGPLLGGLVVMWFVGAAAAYIVGEILLSSLGDDAWRWMLVSATLPATVIVLLRHGTPESPRWLANKGRTEEAEAVLKQVYGPDVTLADLPAEAEQRENVDLKAIMRSGYGGRMLYISVFWTCSIVPLFAIYAFGPKILDALRLEGGLANIGEAMITVMFLIGCVIALFGVNRMGRRPLVIHSFVWSGVALLLGIFPDAPSGVIMTLFALYAVIIGGTQILQWIYPNELFPTEVRGSAVGLASSASRIGAAVGTYLVPIATPKRSFNVALNMSNIARGYEPERRPGSSLMTFSPGSLACELLEHDDDEIRRIYLDDLDQVLPGFADKVVEAEVQRWPTGAPYCFPGRGKLQQTLTRRSGRVLLAGDYLGTLYTETAIQTGLSAAQEAQSLLATDRQATPRGRAPVHAAT